MPMVVLEAAIELLGKYQSELNIRDIRLSLAQNGDIDVSIVPPARSAAESVPYGRIERFSGKFRRLSAAA